MPAVGLRSALSGVDNNDSENDPVPEPGGIDWVEE